MCDRFPALASVIVKRNRTVMGVNVYRDSKVMMVMTMVENKDIIDTCIDR